MELEIFKERLNKLNLTLTDFAEMTKLSYSAVSKFGKSNPVPSWVESYLDGYESKKDLDRLKETIIALADKLNSQNKVI